MDLVPSTWYQALATSRLLGRLEIYFESTLDRVLGTKYWYQALGTSLWVDSGSMLAQLWVDYGSTWGLLRVDREAIKDCFGVGLGSIWDRSEIQQKTKHYNSQVNDFASSNPHPASMQI